MVLVLVHCVWFGLCSYDVVSTPNGDAPLCSGGYGRGYFGVCLSVSVCVRERGGQQQSSGWSNHKVPGSTLDDAQFLLFP